LLTSTQSRFTKVGCVKIILMTAIPIPKDPKKRDKLIKAHLIGEKLKAQYDEVCNQGLKIAKEMSALIGKVNEAKLKIKKATQTKDGPIVIDDYLTRKNCLLNIKIWANDYLALKKELDINIRKNDYLFLHMKNRVVIGLSNVANLVAKNRGKEPKAFTGLSVVKK
jgi:hypothetical protein